MAPTSSHMPPKGGATSRPSGQSGGVGTGATEAIGATQKQAQQTVPQDHFSAQTLSAVMSKLRDEVTRATGRATSSLHVKTEELRAEMRQAMQSGKEGELSEFEKVFLQYFMGNKSFAAMLRAGMQKFRKKKAAEWREFFERLHVYTKEKSTPSGDIKELILRGLSDEDPRVPEQASTAQGTVLVTDLTYKKRNGRERSEKFVRLPIPSGEALARLQEMTPGDSLSTDDVASLFGDVSLDYLSLYYKPVREALSMGAAQTLSESMDRQAEAAARAREALRTPHMGISSHAAGLAAEQLKKTKK